jgi:hypothetical protein
MTLNEITNEISAGRPVVATINWNSGSGEHFVAIAGVFFWLLDLVLAAVTRLLSGQGS